MAEREDNEERERRVKEKTEGDADFDMEIDHDADPNDSLANLDNTLLIEEFGLNDGGDFEVESESRKSTSRRRSRVDVEVEAFPGNAGAPLGFGTPKFKRLASSSHSYSPSLENPELWELVRWLLTSGLSSRARELFFKLKILQDKLPWRTEYQFMKAVDSLPHGPDWKCVQHTIEGETYDLWLRDPVECVAELLGNPAFASSLSYSPMRLYRWDSSRRTRIFNEMWTGDWWWRIQLALSKDYPNATIAPIILASDKTQLSVFSSNSSAWPVYLTLGNIPKHMRRLISLRTTILIAYIPVPKFDHITDDVSRREARHRLFHQTMSLVLNPLKSAGETGVHMICADSVIRHIFPIVATYIADFPEQCLIASCQESCCPVCEVSTEDRGDLSNPPAPTRDVRTTLHILASRARTSLPSVEFVQLGLRPTWPFWSKLPFTNIFEGLTPDVLHQLHKGIFKDHLFKWCGNLMGKSVLDRHYQLMPNEPSIRHFMKSITSLKQTTGKEHREMEKAFLSALSGVPNRVITAARALMDFIYTSHYSTMSEEDINALDHSLQEFHDNKHIFEEQVGQSGFSGIKKLHAISHYSDSIRLFGTPDGFSSETPERYHIDYAKDGYNASNRNNPLKQMVMHLQRDETVRLWSAYLSWSVGSSVTRADQLGSNELEEEGDSDSEQQPTSSSLTMEVDADPYPKPSPIIAKTPAYSRCSPDWFARNLLIPDIISSLNSYLRKKLDLTSAIVPFSDRDSFDVWTRFRLVHGNHGLSTVDCSVTQVVQARPAKRIADDESSAKTVTTSALILVDDNGIGIQKYRAAQIKAIFALPASHHYSHLIPGQLAYVEYYSPFAKQLPRNPHRFYTLSHSKRSNGQHVSGLVPLDRIKLVCHVVPQFKGLHESGKIWTSVDTLQDSSSFYLNEFSSHLFYSYMKSWSNIVV